jgi:hypothetical protein
MIKKAEDEDELEDDYDLGTKGDPPARFSRSPTRRPADTPTRFSPPPIRRSASPGLSPLTFHLAVPPIRRFADPFLPHPLSRLFACFAGHRSSCRQTGHEEA